MAISGLWSRLTAGIFGAGIGIASADAIEPLLEPAKQQAWSDNKNRVLELDALAELVAQALVKFDDAKDEAARTGFNSNRLLASVQGALRAPGTSELLALLRRREITEAEFEHGLRKAQLEPTWDAKVRALRDVLLSAQDLAVMVQRGIVPNDGLLPVGPPTGVGKVPPMPMIDVDPVTEAGKSGVTRERLAGLARIIGLPASPDLAARMVFRQIIERVDFDRAVSEGNTRNEWAPFLFEGFREILTAHDYAELELRGFLDRGERLTNTGKHGMSHADSDLLFNLLGRSIPVHQITTGEARGGVYNGPHNHIPEAFLSSLQRGNLRPEYYNLGYANRYSYPSAFFIRLLLTSGAISADEAHTIFLQIGWPPALARKIADALAPGAGAAKPDPHVALAERQVIAAAKRAVLSGEKSAADVEPTLAKYLPDHAVRAALVRAWEDERGVTVKPLTPSQIRKAYRDNRFTLDEAVSRLEDLHMTADNADVFLRG